jgi:protein-S-isoprenylcysteine O-methyltransferase Ste14/uncharacterized membrane protein (UPF0127 family)
VSLYNKKNGESYPYQVVKANNIMTRMIGLLGSRKPDPKKVLYISPCASIHTFGMSYPIDVIFVDKNGKILHIDENLKPNKISKTIPSAAGVLEFAPGAIKKMKIETGDQLGFDIENYHQITSLGLRKILHWPSNIFISILWGLFVYFSFTQWQDRGGILSLGLLVVNTMFLLLFLTRRESIQISAKAFDWIIPLLTIVFSLLLRPVPGSNDLLNTIAFSIQIVGILLIFISALSLGRSFGVVPANRKIKISGFYRVVRHPLYSSELIFHLGFILGNMSSRNLILTAIIVTGQIYRIFAEEKLLKKDTTYVKYMAYVRYRLLPGIF